MFALFLIFDKEKILKKELLYLIIPFFIGIVMYYITSDYILFGFNGTAAGHKFNIKQNLSIMYTYLYEFNKGYLDYIFYLDKFVYLFILISSVFILLKRTKRSYMILIICFSILLAHLITCYSYVIFIDKIYTRQSLVIFHSLILAFILFILLGELYNSNKSKIIKSFVIIFLICITLNYGRIFLNNYSDLMNENSNAKQYLYKLDEINLIYNILGESSILPVSIFYNDIYKQTKIFIFQDDIKGYSPTDYKKLFFKHNFSQFYKEYHTYFNKVYKKDLIGFYVVDDETAYKELKKRINILNNFIENKDKNSSKKLNFNNLFKYRDIKINFQDIEKINITNENKYILLKIKAFLEYKNHNYTSAIMLYKEYLTKYPDDYDALINLALIYTNIEDLNEAKKIDKILYSKYNINVGF